MYYSLEEKVYFTTLFYISVTTKWVSVKKIEKNSPTFSEKDDMKILQIF